MSRVTVSGSRKNKKRSKTRNNNSRQGDPIIAQHSNFFSPRMPNTPGYYIFINPNIKNDLSKKISTSILNNIIPNYDIQQIWLHPDDTNAQWGLQRLQEKQTEDGTTNKKHWIHPTGTYLSKYNDWNGATKLFSSVINRLKFENYISWGAKSDEEYYACGEWLNPAFFDHRNARVDCAFVMIHYTIDQKAINSRYNRFIDVVSSAIVNQEETYIENFIMDANKDEILEKWRNTSKGRRNSNLRKSFPAKSIFGNMINGGFLYVRDLNIKSGVNYLYIEGICASKFAGKAKRRGNDKTRFHNGEKKIIIPHPRTGIREASPGLEFVDMTNIISYMSGYKGTKLSALIHVINFYFTKFNFKFLQQSIHDRTFKNPQPYDNQEHVDQLVADLSKAKGNDQAKTLEYQKLFNFDGILTDSAHVHSWPERYKHDWRRRINQAKNRGLALEKILQREYERYVTHNVGDDGFNQYFIWDSFNLPVLPEQRLTQVTKAIMADANPGVYGKLLQAPSQQQQQQTRRGNNICTTAMKKLGQCNIMGGRRTRRRRKNKKKRTKKKARRRRGGRRKTRRRRKRRKSRR